MFESQNPEKINIKNLSFDKPEKEGKTPEELREEFRHFLKDTFLEWYSVMVDRSEISEATNHLPELISPNNQAWQTKKKRNRNLSKFGEYTINPETIDIDWEAIPPEKIKVIKIPDDRTNEQLSDIAEYVIKTYGEDYYIPGIEYLKYIVEHSDKTPEDLKGNNWNLLFGSILCGVFRDWVVPFVKWHAEDTRWSQDAESLGSGWLDSYRVVLLEKSAVVRKQKKDFLKPTPPMPEIRKF